MTDNSRLMFAAKGVGAFFVFLVPFLAASTYFGGGLFGIEVSIVLAIIVAGSLLILWPRLRSQSMSSPTPSPAPTPMPNVPANSHSPTELCDPGPYDVVYGDTVKLPLDVEKGDKVQGFVREVNNDFFDWYIADEDEMIRFFDGMPFRPIDGEKNTVVSKVSCEIPHPGPWYLLLDIGSRQNDRQVEVILRRNPF